MVFSKHIKSILQKVKGHIRLVSWYSLLVKFKGDLIFKKNPKKGQEYMLLPTYLNGNATTNIYVCFDFITKP